MLASAEEEKIRTVVKTHWFIFLSFATALIMYTFVVFAVTRGRTPNEDVQAGTLRHIFIIVSVIVGAIKFWVQIRLLSDETSYRKCQNVDEIIAKYWSYNFIMLAICEAPALLGLVIVFLTMRMEEWLVFFAISAVLFATSTPSPGKLESIAGSHAAHHQSDS
ncbi:MAG: hypothetical protein C4532_19015 [Candidatus Abyssobacteria bacterium SURF_17]|uniref:Uncharacterized protein n=1 Tax=Candidatus Abyssobacteria bacterium SURF_17 TaxID=2093361 RepID=A0A419EP68_9BACT|nr:MAG: hypothetical protein C4532_19015 [Candidatus Abyssubacteria bacterium SURF_17]